VVSLLFWLFSLVRDHEHDLHLLLGSSFAKFILAAAKAVLDVLNNQRTREEARKQKSESIVNCDKRKLM
jgi:hypothetical protein